MAAWYLALKDLRLLLRDRMALFWVLGFPVLFALFIGAVVRAGLNGDTGPLPVMLVDESKTDTSRRIASEIARHQRLRLTAATAFEAREAVRRAEAVAYLRLPARLGTLPEVRAELGFDPAREIESAFLEQLFVQAMVKATGRAAAVPEEFGLRKTQITARGAGRAFDIVFPSVVSWGLIGCAACFAVSLVSERTRGTYVRLRALPLPRRVVVMGKALASLLANLAVASILTFVGVLAFGVQVQSLMKLGVALSATALCFVGITMALSVLGRTEQAVAGAGWATLLVMAMLGGGMVPLSLLPEWLLDLSHLSPVKWGILALEGATWRDFSANELALPCAVLLGVGLVSFVVGAVVFERTES
ncbi:MAG TPA: ABC transporter permease [Polyangiaceae bacterium]|nr:ABC transporter permease [Polyangiaceae bacterium]